jgi:hypothetical protein
MAFFSGICLAFRFGTLILPEPMTIYGFCKPRTESLEKMGYTSELVGRVAPGQGLLRKS